MMKIKIELTHAKTLILDRTTNLPCRTKSLERTFFRFSYQWDLENSQYHRFLKDLNQI